MNSQNLQLLHDAFEHPAGGIVGLVDDLLKFCEEPGLRLHWHSERCQVLSLDATETLLEVPLHRSAFRAILARIAALCNERVPGSVSPYGGQGELSSGENPSCVFAVRFANTQSELTLELNRKSRGAALDLGPAPCQMDKSAV
jgi:hypothetical protein